VGTDVGESFGLIVDGISLTIALKFHSDLFREVCMKCFAVVCCRMSPLQKSEVVRLVKTSHDNPVTAAIGDGANDVSMIQEAHVGIGNLAYSQPIISQDRKSRSEWDSCIAELS